MTKLRVNKVFNRRIWIFVQSLRFVNFRGDVAVDVEEDADVVAHLENNNDQVDSFENVSDNNNGHDLVLVEVGVVSEVGVFNDLLQIPLIMRLNNLHKLPSVDHFDGRQQPAQFEEVEEAVVFALEKVWERNKRDEVQNEPSFQVSLAKLLDVSHNTIWNIVHVLHEKFQNQI